MKTGKLEGRVAIVTGATSGIGEAIAYRFAEEGAKVVLSGRREAMGTQNAQKILDAGGEAIFVKTDVTKEEEVKQVVKTTMATYGRVDILVNNAGILMPKRFEESTIEDWYKIMSVDGLGYLLCMWEVLPIMKKQGSGCVINVSSKSATRPSEVTPFYCFVKAGMDHLTRCLNNDYAEYGIRLNSLSPGLTYSEMTKDEPRFYELAKAIPMKRYATAEEIAGSAVFLASEDASYISGAAINVDGGLVS
ncbi:MAG: SDR family oxidoreductase [Thermodesulfobacteriota bacterium]|jgi:NAD(P)-dependent dehydrogenase (short-subunit alcohol dehydrogenase family)